LSRLFQGGLIAGRKLIHSKQQILNQSTHGTEDSRNQLLPCTNLCNALVLASYQQLALANFIVIGLLEQQSLNTLKILNTEL